MVRFITTRTNALKHLNDARTRAKTLLASTKTQAQRLIKQYRKPTGIKGEKLRAFKKRLSLRPAHRQEKYFIGRWKSLQDCFGGNERWGTGPWARKAMADITNVRYKGIVHVIKTLDRKRAELQNAFTALSNKLARINA